MKNRVSALLGRLNGGLGILVWPYTQSQETAGRHRRMAERAIWQLQFAALLCRMSFGDMWMHSQIDVGGAKKWLWRRSTRSRRHEEHSMHSRIPPMAQIWPIPAPTERAVRLLLGGTGHTCEAMEEDMRRMTEEEIQKVFESLHPAFIFSQADLQLARAIEEATLERAAIVCDKKYDSVLKQNAYRGRVSHQASFAASAVSDVAEEIRAMIKEGTT